MVLGCITPIERVQVNSMMNGGYIIHRELQARPPQKVEGPKKHFKVATPIGQGSRMNDSAGRRQKFEAVRYEDDQLQAAMLSGEYNSFLFMLIVFTRLS
jgi:hypothetical protein